jgi:hypothetical protein
MRNSVVMAVAILGLMLLGFTNESIGQDKVYRVINRSEIKKVLDEAKGYSFNRGRYETTEKWQERLSGEELRNRFCIQTEVSPKLTYKPDSQKFNFIGVKGLELGFLVGSSQKMASENLITFLPLEWIRLGEYPENFTMTPKEAEKFEPTLIVRLKGCVLGSLGIVPEEIVILESLEEREIARWSYKSWWHQY